jgi:hypothetical protein
MSFTNAHPGILKSQFRGFECSTCASSIFWGFYLCDRGPCIEERKKREQTWFDEHKERRGHDSWWYVNPGEKKKKNKKGKRE